MRLFLFGFCVCVCVFESCVYAQYVFSVLILIIISFCSLYCDIAQCRELMICHYERLIYCLVVVALVLL